MPGQNISRIFNLAKGFRGRAKNCQTIARNAVERAMRHEYRNRKIKHRNYRASWIKAINSGAREVGTTYSFLMHSLKFQDVALNRRILSQLAMYEPLSFRAITTHVVKETIASPDNHVQFPMYKDYDTVGLVASNIVVETIPEDMIAKKPKARRHVANYY